MQKAILIPGGVRFVQTSAISMFLFFSQIGLTSKTAKADSISPNVTGLNQQYSGESVNTAYFGSGPAGHLSEASQLRFEGEQDVRNGKTELGLRRLAKAVQLDPADPNGHLLYARALSAKIKTSPADASSLPLIYKALDEWKMLWHHDADSTEQSEAKGEAHRLAHIAKIIVKREHDNHGMSQEEALAAATQRSMQ